MIAHESNVALQIILSVAEHHGNLVPWQLLAARTGAVLRFVPLTKDNSELDMAVCSHSLHLKASCFVLIRSNHSMAQCVYVKISICIGIFGIGCVSDPALKQQYSSQDAPYQLPLLTSRLIHS